MASRRKGRIIAFQALYFWEASRVQKAGKADFKDTAAPVEDLISFTWLDEGKLKRLGTDVSVFSGMLVAGTIENISEIDNAITRHLDNWDISRLNRVDLAILRISVYSLIHQREIAPSIVIDEAIELCQEFSTDESYKFVNGVLDSIRKSIPLKDEKQKKEKQ